MKKRIQKSLCALLALIMLLSIVPVSSVSAAPAGDRLDGWNETIYEFLKTNIAAVASGQQASTEFTITDTANSLKWTTTELGVSSLISNGSISNAAMEALGEVFAEVVDLDAIMHSLIADFPYELYWYDKTTGVQMGYRVSGNTSELRITEITFSLSVCDEYAAGQYTVDTDTMKSVASITDNAMAIVEKHADKSDWDKLVAYKDEICELVSYNHSAADNASTPYGNPWQLIYVFDMDPSTNVVCEGYAKAFKLLCDLTTFQDDVYCYTVTGYMQGGTGAGDHMWNVVDINGGRLMADVTNCDAGTIGAPDQLFLTAGTKYGDSYGFPASNSIIYYTYDPDEYGLYTDGYLELTPVPEQEDDTDISTEPATPIDPLAIKFDEIVGYCDTFYESIPWYVVCKLSWDLIDWNYDGEPPVLQIPAAEYEAAAAKYCVLTESMLNAIRNETDYEGNPIYDPETHTYTVFFVGGWGGFLHNRVYAGYVQTDDDTYDVYYMTINYEFLDEILPDGTSLEDVVGEDWPEKVEYEGYTYTNGPDGYYRIAGYSKSGIKYGVKYDGENVMIATRTPYSVGQQPENFDDITIEDILTYEIVDGEAIVTDCADTFSGEITIPNTLGGYPVTTIAEFAFAHLTNPISVNTGNSVKTISNAAFLGCYGLESVTLGDNVQSVDKKAFEACDNLQSFAVSANNPNFSCVNGVLYNKNQTVLLCAPKTVSGEFTIPGGVLTVGEYAFDGCMSLTDLVVGNDVTTIGKRAFNNCMNLTSIKLGSSVKTIDEYAFMNCSRINKLIAPLSLTDIKDHAFERCTGLTVIYYAGTQSQWIAVNIGGNNEPIDNATIHYESDGSAPADPWYLTYEIVDGEAVITDCADTFTGSLTIPDTLGGCPVTQIGTLALSYIEGLITITLPNSVTVIGDYAFAGCNSLTDITIPDSVTSLGNGIFNYCHNLESVVLPSGLTSIGKYAFQFCYALRSVNIPSGVTSIGLNAFGNCESLTAITLPSGLESIGERAFYRCLALEQIELPESVKTIGKGAFELCCSLTEFVIPEGVTNIDLILNGCTNLTEVTIPDSVTDFYGTFCGCTNLRSVTLPDTLKCIGSQAFAYCWNLETIIIPDGVTSIGYWAFQDCESLNNIVIPGSVTSIAREAFTQCSSLTDITFCGTEDQWNQITIGPDNDELTSAVIHYDRNCDNGHHWDDGEITAYPSCTSPGEILYRCTLCEDAFYTDSIDPLSHGSETVVNKATLTSDGSIITRCPECKAEESITFIPRIDVFSHPDHWFIYDGTQKTPVPIVWDREGNALIEGQDYTISYPANRTELGEYTLTITFKGNYSGTKTLTFEILLGTPTTSAANTTTGVNVSWNAIIGAKSYNVYKSVNTGGKWSSWTAIKTGVTGTTYTDTSVKSNDNVKYMVRAVNGSHLSDYEASSAIKFLAAPTVTVSNATNGVKITWNAISGAKDYKVYKSVYSGGKWSSWTAIKTGVTGTTYTDTSVKSNDNVKYTVRAFNGSYSSTYQSSSSIKFLATPTVTVSNATNGVKISWNAISGAKNYKVYKSVYSGGKWSSWTAIKTGVTGTTYTDTTVKSNDNVRYTAKAINSSFTSNITASSSIKFLATPNVTVSNATNGVKITWNAVSGAKTYTVYKSVYTNGAWSGWKAIKTGVTGTTYTDTTVKSNDNVRYTVKVINGSFTSYIKASNSIKFLATPTVKAANAAKGVTVTWNKVTGAKSYIVYRSTYSGGKWSGWTRVATGVTGTSYTDTTVKSGATVRYTVKVVNGNFNSHIKASNTTKFLTQPTVKVAKATNGIKASWAKVTGASGYIVYRRTYSNGKWSGWTQIKTTTAVSYTDTTAKTGVTYQYTVRAYSGDYKSSYTNSSSIKR